MVCSGQDGGVKIEVQERYTSRTHFSTVYRKTEYRFSFLSFFLPFFLPRWDGVHFPERELAARLEFSFSRLLLYNKYTLSVRLVLLN
jgi:hypothetical protein